jgi:hypothetical protein
LTTPVSSCSSFLNDNFVNINDLRRWVRL